MDFKTSKTKENLMRAFAGESQARNRYTIAANEAKAQELYVIEGIFTFTAHQEREHAEIFYNFLTELSDTTITVDGTYPVDISRDVAKLLRFAEHNEHQEHDIDYKGFAEVARTEGFIGIANTFTNIADIEKTHGERFGRAADMLENGTLFVSSVEEDWMCLNCGHISKGTKAPTVCPVCKHPQGYFVRISLAPFTRMV
jgi:rubrerythrin